MKLSYFFPHDADASADPKIVALINEKGFEGYGRFWAIVEILFQNSGYISASGFEFRALAAKIKMTTAEAQDFIAALVNDYELLKINEAGKIFSARLCREIEYFENKRKRAAAAVSSRWNQAQPQSATPPKPPPALPDTFGALKKGDKFILSGNTVEKIDEALAQITSPNGKTEIAQFKPSWPIKLEINA